MRFDPRTFRFEVSHSTKKLHCLHTNMQCIMQQRLRCKINFRVWSNSFKLESFHFFFRMMYKYGSHDWNISWKSVLLLQKFYFWYCQINPTLDSGINVAHGITVAPPLKNFHIMILILFYTNLGIAIIFEFFLSSKFFKN